MTNPKPKVSVIVATRNSGASLAQTIESVSRQNYSNLELVIIDGNSTDTTKEVARQYQSQITTFISEPDQGISDAFNKGLKASTGDYIIFLGSGDSFIDEQAVELSLAGIDPDKTDLICGRVARVKNNGQILAVVSPQASKYVLLFKMSLPHQGLFSHKRFFEKYGEFDLTCRFAMDYELLLRAFRSWPGVVIKSNVVATWGEGGVGTNRLRELLKEYDRIKRKNHVAPNLILSIINSLILLRYKLSNWQ